MASMYETIMDLPLFKGLGAEQVSLFLEKTKVEFVNYEDGQIIADPNVTVKALDFILSGRVGVTYKLENIDIRVSETLSSGNVMGAIRLFGLSTKYTSLAEAIGKVSIMRIDKEQYLRLLVTDNIFLLNFLNYLSAAAQRPREYALSSVNETKCSALINLAMTLSNPTCKSVSVIGDDKTFAAYCGISLAELQQWKNCEEEEGKILNLPGKITILKTKYHKND